MKNAFQKKLFTSVQIIVVLQANSDTLAKLEAVAGCRHKDIYLRCTSVSNNLNHILNSQNHHEYKLQVIKRHRYSPNYLTNIVASSRRKNLSWRSRELVSPGQLQSQPTVSGLGNGQTSREEKRFQLVPLLHRIEQSTCKIEKTLLFQHRV
jgi:hypothetical protein